MGVLGAVDHEVAVGDVDFGHGLAPVAQPRLHDVDLVLLPVDDAGAERPDGGAGAVFRGEAGHDQGLGVVADHAGHEVDVGGVVAGQGAVGAGLVEGLELGHGGRVGAGGGGGGGGGWWVVGGGRGGLGLRGRFARACVGRDAQECGQEDPGELHVSLHGRPATTGGCIGAGRLVQRFAM